MPTRKNRLSLSYAEEDGIWRDESIFLHRETGPIYIIVRYVYLLLYDVVHILLPDIVSSQPGESWFLLSGKFAYACPTMVFVYTYSAYLITLLLDVFHRFFRIHQDITYILVSACIGV